MKENLTEIVAIIDASGSMGPFVYDTIGGFNTFLETQKSLDGEANITIVSFDSVNPHNVLYDGVDVKVCEGLTAKNYIVGAMTPLYDAIGHTIISVGNRLSSLPEEERPSKVLFLISTDGEENSSRDFNQIKIKEMIEHQKSKYNWEFVFTAANIDAKAVSGDVGINCSAAYDQNHTRSLYTNVFNSAATSYRTTGLVNLDGN